MRNLVVNYSRLGLTVGCILSCF